MSALPQSTKLVWGGLHALTRMCVCVCVCVCACVCVCNKGGGADAHKWVGISVLVSLLLTVHTLRTHFCKLQHTHAHTHTCSGGVQARAASPAPGAAPALKPWPQTLRCPVGQGGWGRGGVCSVRARGWVKCAVCRWGWCPQMRSEWAHVCGGGACLSVHCCQGSGGGAQGGQRHQHAPWQRGWSTGGGSGISRGSRGPGCRCAKLDFSL